MRALAFSVHVLTAFGAALAALALLAASAEDWTLMFALLGAALIVDAVDGPLARRLNVKEKLPRWSGDTLDLIVDYATYVLVPAFAVAAGPLMPDAWAILAGMTIAVTGALYFADRNMKTADSYFLGFPAVWNVIVFYLFVLRPEPWLAIATVAVFAVLTFVPVRFVHPFRVARLRALTVALLGAWAVLALIALAQDLDPDLWVSAGLCAIAAYFLIFGLLPPRRAS